MTGAAADAALIWCPFADGERAASVADVLLAEGLVVCANIMPAMRSLFVWNGARGEASEAGALFKTRAVLLDAAVARIAALHDYEQPAILGWRCDSASPATLAWLGGLPG